MQCTNCRELILFEKPWITGNALFSPGWHIAYDIAWCIVCADIATHAILTRHRPPEGDE